MKSKKSYLIICEGDSEYAYVQELNRILNERGSRTVLLPCNAHGGGFSAVRQVCRARKTRDNGRTFIFADRDIYFRNDNGNGGQYESEKAHLPPFLFQTWNFEDFLLMHFPVAVLAVWRERTAESGHREHPLHADEYLPLYEEFCRDHQPELHFEVPYEKGDMPFSLTECHIANLQTNNAADFPHSDFADLIAKLRNVC